MNELEPLCNVESSKMLKELGFAEKVFNYYFNPTFYNPMTLNDKWNKIEGDYGNHNIHGDATLTTIDVYLFRNFWKIKTIRYMVLEVNQYVIVRPEDYPLPKEKCVIKLPYGLYIETDKTAFKFIEL